MASSTIYHARSISLPSRSHPVAEQLDEQLSRLRSSQSTSTSSSVSLNGLTDLYTSVDEFLQLPFNQQTLSQTNIAKWVDQVLDGSLRLLDLCSASRDAMQQSRERLQDVQSALRRRCSGELSITNEAIKYLNTRKSVKKAIKKCLKNLKPTNEQKNETRATVNMLKDVQELTADTLKSCLSYIGGSQKSGWSVVATLISKNSNKEIITSSEFDDVDVILNSLICQKKNVQAVTADTLKSLVSYIAGSQKSGWSVVAKLVTKNNNKEVATSNEFDDVDATLNSLICQKKSGISSSQMDNLTSQTLKLESEIQDVDEALECLFRHLVKTRATLLNIISN
ncbi:uncharacterized protein LOC141649854 [Silene latifolia]|uniref:uncharacterized protein LOC141649854 n=1 Tax=Silene latifolia TaxID=37657 RepID=UPI003D779AF1